MNNNQRSKKEQSQFIVSNGFVSDITDQILEIMKDKNVTVEHLALLTRIRSDHIEQMFIDKKVDLHNLYIICLNLDIKIEVRLNV